MKTKKDITGLIKLFISICLQDRKDVKIFVEEINDKHILNILRSKSKIKYRILLNVTLGPNDGIINKLNKSVNVIPLKNKLCKIFNLKPDEVTMFHTYTEYYKTIY